MEIQSDDYHDFVFKGGRLVGEFEQMYAKSRDIPWHQDKDSERLDCKIAAELIASETTGGSVLEIGAGLGYFGAIISNRIGPCEFVGTDVSLTAVQKARVLFPAAQFEVLDITKDLIGQGWKGRCYDLVVIRGCFWYLFNSMEQVVANIATLTKPNGRVFVAQNFPPLENSFVGKEVLPNPEALMEFFRRHFDIFLTNSLNDNRSGKGNDDWTFFFATRK